MRPNGILIALLSAAALFILNGRADAKDESFSAYVEHAGKILKNDICPRLDGEEERARCNTLTVKGSVTNIGVAYVLVDECNAIYIEPFITILSDEYLKFALAHEVGHIVSQKCLVGNLEGEILADLYSAKIVGSKIVIQGLIKLYDAMTPATQRLASYEIELRLKRLILNGW